MIMQKPILFNTEMVQAILEGRKTVTRRVVQPHNTRKAKLCEYTQGSGLWVEDGYIKDYSVSSCWMKIEDYISKYYIYKPGDILWVREKWRMQNYGFDYDTRTYQGRELQYRADLTDGEDECYGRRGGCAPCRWRPSIQIPKAAARLFLRVTAVRVERLQNISSFDVLSEGVFDGECNRCREEAGGCYPQKSEDVFCGREDILADKYADLWDSTIKPADLPRYGWDANPFVWAVEFERCERPENFLKEGTDHEQ